MGFDYRKPAAKSAGRRHVNPYHLMQFTNRWYLLAHDRERRDIRSFVLGRMRDAKVGSDRFVIPADFNPKKYFDHSLGVMTGTGDYEVVIELDAWLTDISRGRKLHPSQDWTELPGGGSQLKMRLSCLEEIEQWVLGWGVRATVIRPSALAQRVAQTAAELVRRYRDKDGSKL